MGRVEERGQAKKLIGAVEHWLNATGRSGETIDDQAIALGIALPPAMRPPEDYEVWPENDQSVLTFLRCQTQWRTSSGGVIGLDYGVVLSIMGLYHVSDRAAVLEDVQVMEHRAIEIMNQRAERGGQKPWR